MQEIDGSTQALEVSVTLSISQALALAAALFRGFGCDDEVALTVAEHVIMADMVSARGHGLGIVQLYWPELKRGHVHERARGRLVTDNGAFLVFDGERGFGPWVGRAAVDAGIRRCQDHGIVVVALRNSYHLGRIGTFGEQAAAAGLVSLHFVNVLGRAPLLAPLGGAQARLSTNPFCMVMPARPPSPPVVLDFATSAIAANIVRVAQLRGETIPPGLLIDHEGLPTTDPAVLFADAPGALLPFGGHKGYALAVMVELMAGALTGGGALLPERTAEGTTCNNMLSILIDPARLGDLDLYYQEVEAMVATLHATPPQKPGHPVLVPGDVEVAARAKAMNSGIVYDGPTWQQIVAIAGAVGVDAAAFI